MGVNKYCTGFSNAVKSDAFAMGVSGLPQIGIETACVCVHHIQPTVVQKSATFLMRHIEKLLRVQRYSISLILTCIKICRKYSISERGIIFWKVAQMLSTSFPGFNLNFFFVCVFSSLLSHPIIIDRSLCFIRQPLASYVTPFQTRPTYDSNPK